MFVDCDLQCKSVLTSVQTIMETRDIFAVVTQNTKPEKVKAQGTKCMVAHWRRLKQNKNRCNSSESCQHGNDSFQSVAPVLVRCMISNLLMVVYSSHQYIIQSYRLGYIELYHQSGSLIVFY